MLGQWSLPLFTVVTITYLLVNSSANCTLFSISYFSLILPHTPFSDLSRLLSEPKEI